MAITVKDLKEKIQFLDDNMVIGSSGHFGELLEVYDIEVRTVSKKKFQMKMIQKLFYVFLWSQLVMNLINL